MVTSNSAPACSLVAWARSCWCQYVPSCARHAPEGPAPPSRGPSVKLENSPTLRRAVRCSKEKSMKCPRNTRITRKENPLISFLVIRVFCGLIQQDVRVPAQIVFQALLQAGDFLDGGDLR